MATSGTGFGDEALYFDENWDGEVLEAANRYVSSMATRLQHAGIFRDAAHRETQQQRTELTGKPSTLCHSSSTAAANMLGIAAMRELTVSKPPNGSLTAQRECSNRAFTQGNRLRYPDRRS